MATEDTVKFGISYSFGGAVSSPQIHDLGSVRQELSEDLGDVPWDPTERWLRNKKDGTQTIYQVYFKRFLIAAEKRYGFNDPRGFLSWAGRQRKVVAVLEALESFAATQPPSTRRQAVSALKTFLESNGHPPLPEIVVEEDPERSFYRGFSREEILRYLGFLDDPWEKMYVLFSKDAGFRARTTLQLRYHHLKPDLEAGMDFCHIYLEPHHYQGRKTAGITFIGPDTVKALRELIKRGKIETNPEICDKRHLEKCKCSRIFPFAYSTINETLNLAKSKAGLEPTLQPVHGLRKFYENALDKVDPPLDHIKKMQLEGHSIGVRWHYTDQEVEQLRPLYQQAYQYLTLSEEAVADRKMKGLLDEVRMLREENERFKEMELRLETIEAQLARTVQYFPKK